MDMCIRGMDEYEVESLEAWIVPAEGVDETPEHLGLFESLDEAVGAIMAAVMDPERPEYSYRDGPLGYSYETAGGSTFVEIDFGDPLHVGHVRRA